MGLDLGEKTIGLALSDTLLTVATPFRTLKRGKFSADAAVLGALIAEHGDQVQVFSAHSATELARHERAAAAGARAA